MRAFLISVFFLGLLESDRLLYLVLIMDVTVHWFTEICVPFVSYLIGQFTIIFQVKCVFRNVVAQLIIKVDSLLVKALLLVFMSELLKLRANYLYFSGNFHLDKVDIATLIDFFVATSTV